MARGMMAGIGSGALVAVLGLGVTSLVTPLPAAPGANLNTALASLPTPTPAVDPPPEGPEAAAPKPAAAPAAEPPPVIEVPAESEFARGPSDVLPQRPDPAQTPGLPAAEAPAVPAPEADTDQLALAGTEPAARPEAIDAPPEPQLVPAPAENALSSYPSGESPVPVPPPAEVTTPALAPVEVTPPVPQPEPPLAVAPDAPVEQPSPEPPGAGTDAIPILPAEEAMPDSIEAPAKPRVITLNKPSAAPGTPATGFRNAEGVTTGRLPTIGKRRAEEAEAAADDEEAAAPDLDAPPIRRFAQSFAAPENVPLYSVVLIDPGVAAGGLDRDTIKALGIPMTIAIDPTRPDARAAAEAFRADGFEVAILASAIPEQASATDIEVAVEAWRAAIPEAVAVVEAPQPVFQNKRALVQPMIDILAREGLGVITQNQGLNAADQLAARAKLPRIAVWRVIDQGRERGPVIERMLSRAAFEAQKGGAVTVMLSAWPESIAGLSGWVPVAEKSVALAPASAVALRAEGVSVE